MLLLKPIRGTQLNRSHPLTRGLVGYWLMNEGAGVNLFDLSGNGNTGKIYSGLSWGAGKFGPALEGGGVNGYVDCGSSNVLNINDKLSISLWLNLKGNTTRQELTARQYWAGPGDQGGYTIQYRGDISPKRLNFITRNDGETAAQYNYSDTNEWIHIVGVYDGADNVIYVNGIERDRQTSAGIKSAPSRTLTFGTNTYAIDGLIDHVMIYNRALSVSQIILLYRELFCVFENRIRPGLISSQIVNLVGITSALSSLSATAKTVRKVGGSITGISNVTALLNSIQTPPVTEWNWIREALFNGMTANAFKLGTALSLGWFWVRISGCSVLYRGPGMGEIDFENILAVSEQDACEISPPGYISHSSGSIYFYIIRRFNNCGCQERTLAAAVKVSIESTGELAESRPNNISNSEVQQVDGNKIQFVWFYCPIAQKSQPERFNVYYDDRTGQIDYENPLATIGYKGRKFYSFQSSTLEAGKYLFAVRAEDTEGLENSSLIQLQIQIDNASLDTMSILIAEAV